MFTRNFVIFGLLALPSLLSGCGLLFGGSQKVDTKAHDYESLRLDRVAKGEWRLLSEDETTIKEDGIATDRSDLAYEHKKSKAIVSLNSVCGVVSERPLDELSKNLLMGLGDDDEITTRETVVDGAQASESTLVTSTSPGSSTKAQVRAVVMRKSGCAYDFMFIAKPEQFETLLPWFDRFLKEFHVR